MISRAEWLSGFDRYVGTPYHHQGRLPGVGMDCPAPLICRAWETGVKPRSFDITGYSQHPDGQTLRRLCDDNLLPITLAEAQPGDVILASWASDANLPRHLGIITNATPGRMYWMQAENRRYKRVLITRLHFGTDGMQLVQTYRVPGVA